MLALLLCALAFVAPPPDQKVPIVTPAEAAKHVDKTVIVQGTVTQIVLSVNLTTHINFGGLYPNHVFTATVFKANQSEFPGIRKYDGRVVQVKGVVRLYRGKPEIVLTDPTQIRLAE
jgi:DNA/RNA endonuclease YhcR with UshA esterase domain